MPRRASIILLFVLTMLVGSLTPSTRVASAEQPYQIASTKKYVNARIKELEGRIKLLEVEGEKLKKELEEVKKSLTVYKTETGKELNELRNLLKNHLHSTGYTESGNKLTDKE